ncbi:MAG: hypothetical protein NW237_12960 [Cyanobacteriota bacterium]|nr:hypothetical protein [Cyanobacteriota bacterium]
MLTKIINFMLSSLVHSKLWGQSFSPSLRLILVVPFLSQIALAVGLTGWLSLRNGQQAVNDVVTQLQHSISRQIEEKLDSFLETSESINQLNISAVKQGILRTQNRESEYYLWEQIQVFPQVTWIYFGSAQDGAFIGVYRSPQGSLQLVINDPSNQFRGDYYALDEQGNRGELFANL